MRAARFLAATGLGLVLLAPKGAGQTPVPTPPSVAPPQPARPAPRKPGGPPDIYFLSGGDRLTGHTVAKRKRDFVVLTPFGTLRLPRAKVERVLWSGTREEWLAVRPEPTPAPTPSPPRPPEIVLVIAGQSFWHAWDPRDAVDPTLRLQVRLDGVALATYVDARLDPRDLPGATVNSFAFDAVSVDRVHAAAPDVRPGRIRLRLTLPTHAAHGADALQRLDVAYQINAGTRAEPQWLDVVTGSGVPRLAAGHVTAVDLRQDAGRMEFSGPGRKRMKRVETFRLDVQAGAPTPVADERP